MSDFKHSAKPWFVYQTNEDKEEGVFTIANQTNEAIAQNVELMDSCLLVTAPLLLEELERNIKRLEELKQYIEDWNPDDIRITGLDIAIGAQKDLINIAKGKK